LAQQAVWKRSEVKDIESGRLAQKFVLVGTFIERPSGLTQQDVPSLIIVSSDGKTLDSGNGSCQRPNAR